MIRIPLPQRAAALLVKAVLQMKSRKEPRHKNAVLQIRKAAGSEKAKHKHVFAYSIETACDKHGWILGYTVHPGNEHDSRTWKPLYDKVKDLDMEMMVVDAGYKTPAIARELIKDGIQPLFPYKRPMTKDGFFKEIWSMSMMSTMTAISVRRIRSLLIGQQTGMVTKNTRVIKASVKTVLIFPNARK